jgi:hypothetical protein
LGGGFQTASQAFKLQFIGYPITGTSIRSKGGQSLQLAKSAKDVGQQVQLEKEETLSCLAYMQHTMMPAKAG